MNAIILAAGLGSRFKEWTQYKHKSLLMIDGMPNLERTILFLKEANIDEIHIVTGHLHESFHYLPEKYPFVHLIYNPHFAEYNSIYSFYLALPFFSNSFIIDADTVCTKNIFTSISSPKYSTYFTITRLKKSIEWCPIIDENKRVQSIKVTDETMPSLSGVSYWTKQDCTILKELTAHYLNEDALKNPKLYWDTIPKNNLKKLYITSELLQTNSLFEMDTQEDYHFICQNYENA